MASRDPSPRRLPIGRVGGTSHAADAVREALGALATPDVIIRILHRALHLSGDMQIPEGGMELRRFVAHPLDSATRFVLGDDAAEQLHAQLAPLVARIPSVGPATIPMSGDESEVSRIERTAVRFTPARGLVADPGRPVVVATRDDEVSAALQRALGRRHDVAVVSDVVSLLDAAVATGQAPIILLDAGAATVQPSTLVTISPDLPDGTDVILWRAGDEARERLSLFADATVEWRFYGTETPVDALAADIAAL